MRRAEFARVLESRGSLLKQHGVLLISLCRGKIYRTADAKGRDLCDVLCIDASGRVEERELYSDRCSVEQ